MKSYNSILQPYLRSDVFIACYVFLLIRNSSVCIVITVPAGWQGFDSRHGIWFISSPSRSDRLWGKASFLSNRYRGFFPRV